MISPNSKDPAYCADALPAFKRPKALILTDKIARNDRRKIDRRAMTERWKEAQAAAG